MSEVKYIAIARFPVKINNIDNLYYILYDFKRKDIVCLSDYAVKVISDSILNIEYSAYADFLTTIWFLSPKRLINKPNRSKDNVVKTFNYDRITIDVIKKKKYEETYIELRIYNILECKIGTPHIPIWTSRVETYKRGYMLYNQVKLIRKSNSEYTSIEIYNTYGEAVNNEQEMAENSNVFKRNKIKCINSGERIDSLIAKAKVLGMTDINISYIQNNSDSILIQESDTILHKTFNKIGFDYSLDIIKNKRKNNITITKEQENSIRYNLYIYDILDNYRKSHSVYFNTINVTATQIFNSFIEDGYINIK